MRIKKISIVVYIALLATGQGIAGQVTVVKTGQSDAGVKVVTPDYRFGEDFTRFDEETQADNILRTPPKVTRRSYIDFIYKDSPYGVQSMIVGPNRGVYGVRHSFPALAQYDALRTAEKDPDCGLVPDWLSGYDAAELGAGIKKTLRLYDKALRRLVADRGWHAQFIYDPALLLMHRKTFMAHDDWSQVDEAWFKEMFVWFGRALRILGFPNNYWRGPMHRSTDEAIARMLILETYPDIPEADQWRKYGELTWNDWWEYRDNPVNDINYFWNFAFPLVVSSHVRGRAEVFADPAMRKYWDRLIDMTTPDGAVIAMGANQGWNHLAGKRLMALEAAARYTGDGRYRFVAHRLLDYLNYQSDVTRTYHMSDHFNTVAVAMAYFLADDSIAPVEPYAGSVVLHHKETLRISNKIDASHFLKDLDPNPLHANVDCNLLCTQKQLPYKLCLRSGWRPGDLYMLVDLFPRHEPMNTTGVIGMARYNSAMTQTIDSKGLTDWQNMFRVDDLAGTADLVTNTNPNTADSFYMDVKVAEFQDSKYATYAAIDVADYMGLPMSLRREFFFVKNRFCVVRDTAKFRQRFLAKIGPNWTTQNVGRQIGDHWANTYMTGPFLFSKRLHNPQMDLLVYHAPRPDRRLVLTDDSADVRRLKIPYTLSYQWRGFVEPGKQYSFTHLLMPGIPSRNTIHSNYVGSATVADMMGLYMADGVKVLADDADKSIWRIRSEGGREEWVVLNHTGETVAVEGLATDATQAYVDLRNGKPARVLLLNGTHLTVNGKAFHIDDAEKFEK